MVAELQETMPFSLLEKIITKICDISNPYLATGINELDNAFSESNDNGIDSEINILCEEVDPFSGFKERIQEWKEILQEIEVALPEEGVWHEQ